MACMSVGLADTSIQLGLVGGKASMMSDQLILK